MNGGRRRSRSASSASATGARTSRATSTRCPAPSCAGAATRDESVRARFARAVPAARASPADLDDLLADPTLDAIVLATPGRRRTPTLAVRVLEAGKHCFVEKPLAPVGRRRGARRRGRASAAGRVLMVGHLLQYHPGVNKLKEIADSGELGDIHYIYGNRLNLGQLRADENALWSLGAHDVSVAPAPRRRGAVRAQRARRVLHARRASRTSSSRSCASPRASPRTCTSRGWTRTRSGASRSSARKRMATFDDMDPERKVTVYDKGFDENGRHLRRVHHALGRHLVARACRTPSRCGWSASTSSTCVRERRARRSPTARSGLRVVRVLEGLQQSLDETRRAGVARVGA